MNLMVSESRTASVEALCIDYYGDWSSYGCEVLNENTDSVTCGCNHLTTFALLLVSFSSSL